MSSTPEEQEALKQFFGVKEITAGENGQYEQGVYTGLKIAYRKFKKMEVDIQLKVKQAKDPDWDYIQEKYFNFS
jgi:hypothetical protein